MFEFFSNKKDGERSIILDIQSGLVRGAIILKKENEPVLVTSLVTKSISSKTNIKNAEHLSKRTLKLISEVVEHLTRDIGPNKVNRIEYILSSPWVFSKLKTIKLNYEKEVNVDQSSFDQIVNDEVKNNESKTDTRLIEQKVFEIRLNGYPVTSIKNKKIHSLEVSIATSFSSDKFLYNVNNTVKKFIDCKNDTLHSGLLLQYTALRNILIDRNEFMYIHVHSELTDLIIVKDGLCKYIASLPFGIQTLLRKVSAGTSETIESSDSVLSLYQGGKLNVSEQARMKGIVDPMMSQWSTLIIDSFKEIFDITNLPKTLILSAHSHFDLFKDALVFKNNFNYDVVSYDSIETGDDIVFRKGIPQSNMMKIYIEALSDKM